MKPGLNNQPGDETSGCLPDPSLSWCWHQAFEISFNQQGHQKEEAQCLQPAERLWRTNVGKGLILGFCWSFGFGKGDKQVRMYQTGHIFCTEQEMVFKWHFGNNSTVNQPLKTIWDSWIAYSWATGCCICKSIFHSVPYTWAWLWPFRNTWERWMLNQKFTSAMNRDKWNFWDSELAEQEARTIPCIFALKLNI